MKAHRWIAEMLTGAQLLTLVTTVAIESDPIGGDDLIEGADKDTVAGTPPWNDFHFARKAA